MRILIVVHGVPPASTGGTEIYAAAHARALRALGDEVLVLAREDDRRRREYDVRVQERDGTRIALINNTYRQARSFEETYRNDALGVVAARVIDEFRPDIAHIHHLTGLSTTIVRSLAERAVPTIMTLHDYWLICHRGQLLDLDGRVCDGPEADGCHRCLGEIGGARPIGFAAAPAIRAIERALPTAAGQALRRGAVGLAAATADVSEHDRQERQRLTHMREVCADVTRFIAPSAFIRDRFIRFGVAADRMVVSQNGIDVAPASRIVRAPDAALRLGFVGSLMVSKAPHVLLEAVAKLPAGAVAVDLFGDHAAYHGDDSYRLRLAPLLERPGVRWHGPIARERIADALASIDALVVPSVWPENSPLVIHEALAAGVPVVASRVGGIPEVIQDGSNGLLFDPGDSDDLSRVIARLLDEPGLLDALRSVAPSGRTMDQQAGELRSLYRSALTSRRARTRRIAAVVLNYRTPDDTLLVVKSLLASRTALDPIIVVDNDEQPTAREALRDVWPSITYMHTGANLGYSGGMNAGIREALARGADAVLLTNSDVIVPPDSVMRLDQALDLRPGAGIAGPIVLARSDPGRVTSLGMSYAPATGRMRHAGFGTELRALPGSGAQVVDGVSGCLMLVRREVFEAIGLLEDSYFFSFEDLDFCLRARAAGFATVIARSAAVHHEGSKSMGPDTPRRLFFAARNHLLLARRANPSAGPFGSFCRNSSIVALNVAHAVRSRGRSLPVRLGAVARGVRDYARGRFGADA